MFTSTSPLTSMLTSSHARKVAFQLHLDVSGQYANPMDWMTSTNATKKPLRRPLVNPHDPWLSSITSLSPGHDGEEEDMYFNSSTCADMDPCATFIIARAAPLASATGSNDLELLSDVEPTYTYGTNPFAVLDHDGDNNSTNVVTKEQRCMIKLLKLLKDMECRNYALAQVIDWAHDAYQQGFNFAPPVKLHDGVLASRFVPACAKRNVITAKHCASC
jgi:hypothetical protein